MRRKSEAMNYQAYSIAKRIIGAIGLIALVILVSGCKTTFRPVDERFMAQPAAHRQVQILPVWFEGAGNVDPSLTTNDLQALSRQAGKDLAGAVQQELQAKGYRVAGPVQIWRTNEIPARLAAEIGPSLEIVRVDFCQTLPGQFPVPTAGAPLTFRTNTTLSFFRYMATSNPKRVRLEHNPFHYRMTSSLTNVLGRLGATNAQAVLLVNTKAFFESPHHHTKRAVWNWTGGGLIAVTEVGVNVALLAVPVLAGSSSPPPPIWADPFWHSSDSLQHNVALVDARTGEALWLNRQDFKRKDPRDAEVVTDTVADTMADLPTIPRF
jgi:hypothetical protein